MAKNHFTRFKEGVQISGVSMNVHQKGKVFYVCNSSVPAPLGSVGSNSSKGLTPENPVSTIDAAVNLTVANRGDKIVVLPGHAETISSATALNLDVAGIDIVGVGEGSLRPTVTLDTATTTTIPVSAANITITNVVFSANFADIVAVFTLTTAKHFKLHNCAVQATATNMNFKYVVDTNATTADADGLTIANCTWIEPDTATESMVKMDGTNDRVTVTGNYVNLGVGNNKAALVVVATGKVVTNLRMVENHVIRLNTDTATGGILFHTDGSTNTGIVADNYAQHADVAAEILITASSGLAVFANYASGVAGASGYILPAVDS